MILRPRKLLPPKGTAIFLMMVIMLQNVNSKPQDPENVASQFIAAAGNMAEMVGNVGMMSKNMDFEMPFAKAKSESKAGTGAALRNNEDDDSSEEDRRKRSTDFQTNENALIGEEFLLPLPLIHQHHFHRDKRSPCHTYGGSTGGGGTGGGDVPTDYDDIEAERRRRAYARKRKAAAKRATSKSKQTSNASRKKKLINNDEEVLVRRKRQSEVDDLNQNMQNASNDFAAHAQQIVERIRSIFDNFAASMNDMAQKLKQHFSAQNATNTMEI